MERRSFDQTTTGYERRKTMKQNAHELMERLMRMQWLLTMEWNFAMCLPVLSGSEIRSHSWKKQVKWIALFSDLKKVTDIWLAHMFVTRMR